MCVCVCEGMGVCVCVYVHVYVYVYVCVHDYMLRTRASRVPALALANKTAGGKNIQFFGPVVSTFLPLALLFQCDMCLYNLRFEFHV